MNSIKILLISFFLSFFMHKTILAYGGNFDAINRSVGDFTNTSFFVKKITFSADIPFSSQEFFYLSELTEHTFINKESINKAYKNLMAKKRFNEIDIDMHEESGGKHIHFTLHANWILKKIEIQGFLFGKYEYENIYTQQPGDIFDEQLHEESLKTLRNFLYTQGYFNASLQDELLYSVQYKTIVIQVKINHGEKFLVKNIKVSLTKEASKKINPSIKQALSSLFTRSIITQTYSKEFTEKLAHKIKRFLKKEGFLQPQIKLKKQLNKEKNTIDLLFIVEPGIRRSISFEGNTIFTESYFRQEIISDDQPEWLFSPEITAEQIYHEYYKKGYWFAKVSYKQPTPYSYIFTIQEGSPIILDSIEIKEGNHYLAEETSYFCQKLLPNKNFDQETLDTAIQDLKKFYLANGFWDFAVIDRQYLKTQDTNHQKLIIFISKGIQRFWGGIQIKEHEDLLNNSFFKKYTHYKQEQLIPFDNIWLAEQKDFLLLYFQKLGYWFTSVEPEITTIPWDSAFLKATPTNALKQQVSWHINLGEQVTFGKIFLRGNTKLPFNRILQEIKFKEDDVWDREKLDLTRKKLKQLEIFKQVQVQPYQDGQISHKKPIIIGLTDDDPKEMRLRAGYFITSKNFMFKRESTPKIGATVIFKNPTNHADRLLFETDITRFERKINGEYQQPSFMNLPAIGKLRGYANKYVHPVQIGSSGSAFEASQSGLLFGLNEEFKNDFFWGITLGNEWIKTSRVRGNLDLDNSIIDKTISYFFIEPNLIIDKLDDKINTTQGSYSYFSLKTMNSKNSNTFTARLLTEQSLFYPINKDIILAARLRFGQIFGRAFSFIQPIERFYLGGPNSVRGYEKEAVPPLGISLKEEGLSTIKEYTIQGGSTMLNTNLEIRFPIHGSLNGVIFHDIGALSKSGVSGFKTVWPATGFGFRYKTPIGSIRFDIGWKWKKRLDNDSSYAWYLTLGEAF